MKKERKKEPQKHRIDPTESPQWVYQFFNQLVSLKEKKIAERLNTKLTAAALNNVYREIDQKLQTLPLCPGIDPEKRAFPVMIAIISTTAIYGPEAPKVSPRKSKKELNKVQEDIILATKTLIGLLDRHADIKRQGRIGSEAFTDVFHLIEKAAGNHGLYLFIAPYIQQVRHFGGKYYPSFKKILEALIQEFEHNKPMAKFPMDALVLKYRKTSPADALRHFVALLDQMIRTSMLPKKFSITHESMGLIVKHAFELVTEDYSESHVSKALSRK